MDMGGAPTFSDTNSLPSLKPRSFRRALFYLQPSQADAINPMATGFMSYIVSNLFIPPSLPFQPMSRYHGVVVKNTDSGTKPYFNHSSFTYLTVQLGKLLNIPVSQFSHL